MPSGTQKIISGYLWRVKDNNGNVRYMTTSSQTLTDGVEFYTGWIDEDGVFQVNPIGIASDNGDYYKYSVSGITTGETTVGPVNYNIPEYDVEFDFDENDGVQTGEVILFGNEFFGENEISDTPILAYPAIGGNMCTVRKANEAFNLALENIPATLKITIKNCPGYIIGTTFTSTINFATENGAFLFWRGVTISENADRIVLAKLPGDDKLYALYARGMQ